MPPFSIYDIINIICFVQVASAWHTLIARFYCMLDAHIEKEDDGNEQVYGICLLVHAAALKYNKSKKTSYFAYDY